MGKNAYTSQKAHYFTLSPIYSYDSSMKTLQELTNLNETYRTKINNIQNENELMKSSNEELQIFNANLISDISELKAINELMCSNKKDKQGDKISALNSEITRLKNENSIIMIQMDSLGEELKETLTTNEELNKELSNNKEITESLKEKLRDLNRDLNKQDQENKMKRKQKGIYFNLH